MELRSGIICSAEPRSCNPPPLIRPVRYHFSKTADAPEERKHLVDHRCGRCELVPLTHPACLAIGKNSRLLPVILYALEKARIALDPLGLNVRVFNRSAWAHRY